jgi:hypothetical protein
MAGIDGLSSNHTTSDACGFHSELPEGGVPVVEEPEVHGELERDRQVALLASWPAEVSQAAPPFALGVAQGTWHASAGMVVEAGLQSYDVGQLVTWAALAGDAPPPVLRSQLASSIERGVPSILGGKAGAGELFLRAVPGPNLFFAANDFIDAMAREDANAVGQAVGMLAVTPVVLRAGSRSLAAWPRASVGASEIQVTVLPPRPAMSTSTASSTSTLTRPRSLESRSAPITALHAETSPLRVVEERRFDRWPEEPVDTRLAAVFDDQAPANPGKPKQAGTALDTVSVSAQALAPVNAVRPTALLRAGELGSRLSTHVLRRQMDEVITAANRGMIGEEANLVIEYSPQADRLSLGLLDQSIKQLSDSGAPAEQIAAMAQVRRYAAELVDSAKSRNRFKLPGTNEPEVSTRYPRYPGGEPSVELWWLKSHWGPLSAAEKSAIKSQWRHLDRRPARWKFAPSTGAISETRMSELRKLADLRQVWESDRTAFTTAIRRDADMRATRASPEELLANQNTALATLERMDRTATDILKIISPASTPETLQRLRGMTEAVAKNHPRPMPWTQRVIAWLKSGPDAPSPKDTGSARSALEATTPSRAVDVPALPSNVKASLSLNLTRTRATELALQHEADQLLVVAASSMPVHEATRLVAVNVSSALSAMHALTRLEAWLKTGGASPDTLSFMSQWRGRLSQIAGAEKQAEALALPAAPLPERPWSHTTAVKTDALKLMLDPQTAAAERIARVAEKRATLQTDSQALLEQLERDASLSAKGERVAGADAPHTTVEALQKRVEQDRADLLDALSPDAGKVKRLLRSAEQPLPSQPVQMSPSPMAWIDRLADALVDAFDRDD